MKRNKHIRVDSWQMRQRKKLIARKRQFIPIEATS